MADVAIQPIQLLCLPHSGASALIYLRWRRALPSWITVRPVELPGRGTRSGEALRTEPLALAEDLADECLADVGFASGMDRYALFGHSLGAVLAFELAHALIARGAPAPVALFASASEAPARRDDRDMAHPKSDADLVADLRRMRGTPAEVLADAELMRIVLPVLRADFMMCGAYRHRRRDRLPCPIRVFAGRGDDIAPDALSAWSDETADTCTVSFFDGDHFFLHERQDEVLTAIANDIDVAAARLSGAKRAVA